MKLDQFKSELSLANKLLRLIWGVVWYILFLPSPRPLYGWRRLLLRLFGAKIGAGVRVYGSAKIYYPPNLTLETNSIVGPHVDVYCVAPVTVGEDSMISQYSYLCAASHDYTQESLPLIASPIVVGEQTWICARAFVGPGVTIGRRSVIAACSVVVKDVEDSVVVGGNPAKFLKKVAANDTEDGAARQ